MYDMDESSLLGLVAEGEHSRLEFKERPGKDTAAVVSGFANAEGGRILFGVSDSGEIVGCSLSNAERAALAKVSGDCDPPVDATITHLANANVTVLDIKQSLSKPVQCSRGYFIREHSLTRKMKQQEVSAMMRKHHPPIFESMICERFRYPEDFSLAKLGVWRKMANLSPDLSAEDVLLNLDLAEKSGADFLLRNAAVLFWAEEPTKFFNQAFATCVLYNGQGKAVVVDRHDFADGVIADIQSASNFVSRNMRIAEKIENRYRSSINEYPVEAVAEALVNAFAHRDWTQRGSQVTAEMFSGRLEITSPGGLPEGVTLRTMEKTSVRRNPLICDLLQKAGLAERIGSGIAKMNRICQQEGCAPPRFESEHYFKATFSPNPEIARSS